ncbi:profilin-1-like [Protopterus annectens]|uniref:profilin-1-like n=1 Tax=Protopterus annectens TaxID=7888 RepID=UPI001CF9B7A3|nr:profilin-1-like [Protopterus annectens]
MSWMPYVDQMMGYPNVQAAAIVGFKPSFSIYASKGSCLDGISNAQVQSWLSNDRGPLFANGARVGSLNCSVIRDSMSASEECPRMELRTKNAGGSTCGVTIAQAETTLAIAVTTEGSHGSYANTPTIKTATYLKSSHY